MLGVHASPHTLNTKLTCANQLHPKGFVSNKTIDASDSGSDPVEVLLYSAFVASSERIALADLAGILNMAVEELQARCS